MSNGNVTEPQLPAAERALRTTAQAEGLCGETRMFVLGAHGTILVACGLKAGHELETADEDVFTEAHMGRRSDGDAQVIFRWPCDG